MFRRFVVAVCLTAGVAVSEDIPDTRVHTYVTPVMVMWTTPSDEGGSVKDAELLVGKRYGQVPEGQFWKGAGCLFTHNGKNQAILLDFGRELHGGIEIGGGLYTEDKALTKSNVRCRIRFGESVTEAMSELGENGACNGHGMRDFNTELVSSGVRIFGDTGFRFIRIDLIEPGTLQLDYVRAISKMRPMRAVGYFHSSDGRLDRIYAIAVRTAHLCAQRFIWDGIKRDRIVWAGDMYPQIHTIFAAFGPDPIVADSLDYLGAITPPDEWMCIPSYTMWWLIGVRDLWFETGDLSFIRERSDYLKATYDNLSKFIAVDGSCTIEKQVIDWPTRKNPAAARSGHQALFSHTFLIGAEMAEALGDKLWAAELKAKADKTSLKGLDPHGSKPAASLLALFNFRDAQEMFDGCLGKNGLSGMSPYFGWFIAEAMCKAGEKQCALEMVRNYWGAMLDMGATSFWEAFDVSWTNNNTVHIDELPAPGKNNIHADNGEFCYKGCRHSLCHGWSCSPAAWITRHVLGISPLEPGCRTIEVKPYLGDLDWAEGAMALPNGKAIKVRVDKNPDGTLKTSVSAPESVKIVLVSQ